MAHQSKTGKALNYSVNQKQYLRWLLTDGDIPMDYNLAEQAIRPYSLLRKNCILINTDHGGKGKCHALQSCRDSQSEQPDTLQVLRITADSYPPAHGRQKPEFSEFFTPLGFSCSGTES